MRRRPNKQWQVPVVSTSPVPAHDRDLPCIYAHLPALDAHGLFPIPNPHVMIALLFCLFPRYPRILLREAMKKSPILRSGHGWRKGVPCSLLLSYQLPSFAPGLRRLSLLHSYAHVLCVSKRTFCVSHSNFLAGPCPVQTVPPALVTPEPDFPSSGMNCSVRFGAPLSLI